MTADYNGPTIPEDQREALPWDDAEIAPWSCRVTFDDGSTLDGVIVDVSTYGREFLIEPDDVRQSRFWWPASKVEDR